MALIALAQAGVLDGDRQLIGHFAGNLDTLIGETGRLDCPQVQCTDQLALSQKRHIDDRANPFAQQNLPDRRELWLNDQIVDDHHLAVH